MVEEPPPRSIPRRTLLGGGLVLALGAAGVVAGAVTRDEPRRPDAGNSGRTPARTRPDQSAPPGGEPLVGAGPVVDVRALGAVGDGRTDDTAALRRGLEEANRSGGTLFFPAGVYAYRSTSSLEPADGVTLAGVPGASTILFDVGRAGGFVSLLTIQAAGVTVDGLELRRSTATEALLIDLGPARDLLVSRTVLDGGVAQFPDTVCHGIKLPDYGSLGNLRIVDSTVRNLTYGLLQTNASTATIVGITVQRCTFTRNHNTDLEFNSPSGSTRGILVERCTFADNDSEGFGVGLAHLDDAVVQDCTFDTYGLEAIHVEDYSTGIVVRRNRFTACGLRNHSHVQVISGCRDVRVLDNAFDATVNDRLIYVVNALPGGTGPTAGGRPPGGPSDVLVRGNTFACSAAVVPIYFQDVRGGQIVDNTISGDAASSPEDAFRLLEDHGTAITGNTINGRTY